jgi:Major tropism determinant N-terminal domain
MSVTILLRHDTSTNWAANNPILQVGEVGIELDTLHFKIGDGSSIYTSLPYANLNTSDLSTIIPSYAVSSFNTRIGNITLTSSDVNTALGYTAANDSTLTSHTSASSGVHGATGSVVGTTDTQTLTNKTISGSANTLSNIPNSALTNNSISINGTPVALGGSILTYTQPKLGNTTIPSNTTVTTIDGLTLTNSTLTGPTVDAIYNNSYRIGIPAPAAADTFMTLNSTGVVINKTISGSSNTITNIPNTATTATPNNNQNTIVLRDTSGNFSANLITLYGTPTTDQHAVTKAYVDQLTLGINWHYAVDFATAVELSSYTYADGSADASSGLGVGATITGNSNGAFTIDSNSVSVGQRILVWKETGSNAKYNGIYTVTQKGSSSTPFILTRATDADNHVAGEVATGDAVLVLGGAQYANQGFTLNSTGSLSNKVIKIGTDSITFIQFTGVANVVAGNGLQSSGNSLSIKPVNTNLVVSPNGIDLQSISVTPGTVSPSASTPYVTGLTLDGYGRTTAFSTSTVPAATTTSQGIASFVGGTFTVTAGAVNLASGGVSNSFLANSSITLGSTSISLGGTATTISGLTLTSPTINSATLTSPTIATITNTGTLTLPTSTDTLVGRATTDTLTNKTFDTAGTGNVFKINGTQVSAITGTGSAVLATSPSVTGLSSDTLTASTQLISGTTSTSGGSSSGLSLKMTGGTDWRIYADSGSTIKIGTATAGQTFWVGSYTTGAANTFTAPSGTATQVIQVVKGSTSQTGDLTQWQNSAGTVISKVDSSGNITGTSFVKSSGTSLQFLKADGSVDSNTYLTSNQSITISGDATGTGTNAITLTLSASGVTSGTYNSSSTTHVPITVDTKGRITSVGTAVTITPAWSSITSTPTTVSGYGITDAATLTGTQTLTNKTLTSPVISTITNTGTLTLPTTSDTLVGRATTDTLTNKTFDTAGTGNVLKISGTQVSAVTGTGSIVLSTSPSVTGLSTDTVTTSGNATIGGNLTVTGNLTISGTTTTVNSQTLSVQEPLIYIAQNNTANLSDIGIVGHYNGGTYYHTGLARNHNDGKWYFFDQLSTEPTSSTIVWANVGTAPTVVAGTFQGSGAGLTNIPNAALTSSSITIGSTSVTLGTTAATIAGLTLTSPTISTITNTGTLTLPTTSDTLVGRATTDTLTNKTFDTAGTGNVLKINGTQVSAVTGTGSIVLATSPTITTPTISGTITLSSSGITFSDATVQTSAGVPSITPINTQTVSITLGATFIKDSFVQMNSASANTVTIPADSTYSYPIGASIDFQQLGAGQTSFVAASGVTIQSALINGTSPLKLRAQYSVATLMKVAANTWALYGDLSN